MKVCFVGAGSIGKRHIKNWFEICNKNNVDLEIHLYRVTDRPIEEILKMVKKVITSEDLLDNDYDAVFITNPTYKHYDTIKLFFDKTNVFFVEKPVLDSTELDISKYDKSNKIFYVACPLRYTNVLLKATEIINNEQVLSVRAISSSYLPNWRKGIDYRDTYSAHKNQGGGVRIDLIHEWDYLISMFGRPERVYSLSGKFSDLEIDSEDLAIYIAKYPDKLVELHLDYFGRYTRRVLEVRTNENEYIFDIAYNCIYKNNVMIEKFKEDGNDKYLREMQFFYNIMNGNCISTNNLCEAVETMRIAGKNEDI